MLDFDILSQNFDLKEELFKLVHLKINKANGKQAEPLPLLVLPGFYKKQHFHKE